MARNTTTSTGGQSLSGTTSGSEDSNYGSGSSGSLDAASGAVKTSASRIKEEAARQGSAAIDSLKEGAQQLGSQAKERASDYVEGGVHAVTQHLDDFAQAIRAASDELSQKDQTMAAQIVRQAANGLESLSRSVSGANVDDIVSSVRRFGRNNPAAFIGGAVLVGLALGRFARASGRHQEDDWRRDGGYGEGGYSGGQSGNYQGGGYAGSSYGGASSSRPYSGSGASAGGGSSYGSSQGGSSYRSSQGGSSYGSSQGGSSQGGSSYGSQSGGSSYGSTGGSPSQSQGYAGGGMGGGSTSGPSSDTDESVASSSSSGGGLGSSSISTGERS